MKDRPQHRDRSTGEGGKGSFSPAVPHADRRVISGTAEDTPKGGKHRLRPITITTAKERHPLRKFVTGLPVTELLARRGKEGTDATADSTHPNGETDHKPGASSDRRHKGLMPDRLKNWQPRERLKSTTAMLLDTGKKAGAQALDAGKKAGTHALDAGKKTGNKALDRSLIVVSRGVELSRAIKEDPAVIRATAHDVKEKVATTLHTREAAEKIREANAKIRTQMAEFNKNVVWKATCDVDSRTMNYIAALEPKFPQLKIDDVRARLNQQTMAQQKGVIYRDNFLRREKVLPTPIRKPDWDIVMFAGAKARVLVRSKTDQPEGLVKGIGTLIQARKDHKAVFDLHSPRMKVIRGEIRKARFDALLASQSSSVPVRQAAIHELRRVGDMKNAKRHGAMLRRASDSVWDESIQLRRQLREAKGTVKERYAMIARLYQIGDVRGAVRHENRLHKEQHATRLAA